VQEDAVQCEVELALDDEVEGKTRPEGESEPLDAADVGQPSRGGECELSGADLVLPGHDVIAVAPDARMDTDEAGPGQHRLGGPDLEGMSTSERPGEQVVGDLVHPPSPQRSEQVLRFMRRPLWTKVSGLAEGDGDRPG
jgi:hypothetical protein